jgi:hypothetical protein
MAGDFIRTVYHASAACATRWRRFENRATTRSLHIRESDEWVRRYRSRGLGPATDACPVSACAHHFGKANAIT